MIDRSSLVVLLGLLALGYALQCPKQRTSPGREVVCYTSATDVGQLTDAVCRCTTLVQQGYDIRNLSTFGFESLRKSLKQINSPLQFMISVNDPEKTLRTSGTIRQEATARLMGILKEVDGVELNVTAGSKERLLHFVKGLKDELIRKSMDKRIFAVLPTKSEDLAKQFDLKELSKYVDLFTVATHYLVEDDESYHTFHPSRLMGLFDMANADSLIDLISGLGAPKRKILVSLPAGAYKFTLKDQDDNAPRSETLEMQPDVIDQKELCDLMASGVWTVERDEDLTAPYAFKNKTWIAFEDKISVGIKGKYALLRDLPGLAINDVENDFRTQCSKPLTHEVHHSFTDFKRKTRAAVLNALEDDLHQTQINYPTKVRSSEFRVVRVVDTEGHIQAIRENTQTEFICTKQGYFVHPKSCNRFYRCVKFNQEVEDYSVFEFDCPAGLSFDERTEVCVWPGSLPQGSPCPGSSEIAPSARVRFECPSQPGYYADPQNPRWFFACIDLGGPEVMAYEFRCPFGLIFDEQKLVCEWPWLVQGYSGNGYTRTEYDSRGYGAGSTQGSGGYTTGGLPHGYSGTPGHQTGGYSGTGGVDYSNAGSSAAGGGSGYFGAAGVGSGFSGAAGVGYSGSAIGSHGSSFGQGSVDYSGSTGSGYSGSANGGYGATEGYGAAGHAYTGSVTGSYGAKGTGSVTGGYGGTGGGYSGSAAGGYGASGNGYTGSVAGGYGAKGTGSVTGGYGAEGTGSATGGYGGTGSGYSGSAAGGYGAAENGYTGSVAGGYGAKGTGSATGGYGGKGSDYSGLATGGHGAGGTGYAGSTVIGGQTATGSGYSGAAVGGHGAAGSGYTGPTVIGGQGTVGNGYSGSVSGGHGAAGPGYTGTTVIRGQGTAGSGYSGSVSGGHGVAGTGYSGSATGGYGGTESGYSGSTIPGGYGAAGAGYSGSENGVHGATGTYATTPGYTGTIGGIYPRPENTGSIDGHFIPSVGSIGSGHTGYVGTTSGVYTGSGQIGSDNSGYSGTGHVSIGSGYAGTGSSAHFGNGGTYKGTAGTDITQSTYSGGSGSTLIGHDNGSGYSGSSDAHAGAGITYTGSTAGGYAGSSGAHAGATGISYTGSTAGGYAGSSGAHAGATGISYAGSTAGGCAGSASGTYSGPSQTTYTKTTGGCAGSSGNSIPVAGPEYSGPSVGPEYSTGGYAGSGTKEGGYTGSGSVYYSGSQGSTVHGYSGGVGYSGPSTSGADDGYSVQTGTKHTGSGLEYTGSQGGFSTSGQTVTVGTQAQVPIYATAGTIGSGYAGSGGVTDVHGQAPGSTFIEQQPDKPSVNYIPSTPGAGGYHGISTGSVVPGQVGVTTTYFGNAGAGGYGKGAVTSGTSIYQGGYKGAGDSGQLNITLVGSRPYYEGVTPTVGYGISGNADTGAIVTGPSVQGSIITGDSSPGTIITYGNTPGTVLSGSVDQGTIITGGSQPGYTKTGSGTPGYVISNGIKTVYPDSASPGIVVHGTPSPSVVLTGSPEAGTILHGQNSPGVVLTGQTAPGVSIGGAIDQGTVVGSTGHQYFTKSSKGGSAYGTKIGTVSGTYDNGYRTNEYHDNGGRGTIKFNNGDLTTKYTENDIPDYRPAGGTIPPDILIPSSTPVPSTPSGFTKTGPTRTGITTASLGGRGSYVISTGRTRPTPNPEEIGEKAFDGNVAGYTKTSIQSTTEDSSYIDSSKITLGPSKSTGYSYPRPNIPFETGPTSIPIGPTQSSVLTATPPTPFLNVEVYNSPKFGQSPQVTGSPAVVNTYGKPSEGPYRGQVPTGFTRAPVPTRTPVLYTTGPVENYKTTLFEAAKIPVPISTVHPVIDNGYKTIVSPTSIPVTVTHDKLGGNIQSGFESTQAQFDFRARTSQQAGYSQGYVSTTTPSSVFGVSSPYSTTARPFGYTSSVTIQPAVDYATVPSGYDYTGSTSKNVFGQNVASSYSGSLKPETQYLPSESPAIGVTYRKPFPLPGVTYQSTSIAPNAGDSPTNTQISRDEVGKLVSNYNRGSTRYVPSEYDIYTTGSVGGSDFSRTQSSSSSFGQSYSTTPAPFGRTQSPIAVTTYTGGYSKPSSLVPYQTTPKSTAVGNAKVIVKWSDLHPLLLGKLGAECTCKGDPFGNLRGPGSKLINSSKGKVDLANYDESEIYVDLEKTDSYEESDYATNYESSSLGPIKTLNNQTPSLVLSKSGNVLVQDKPSSAYLPSVTPSAGLRGSFGPSQNYATSSPNLGFSANYRSGKSLSDIGSTTNSVGGKGASFDRYGPGGLRNSEETLEGATNCARPGLFRHPNFCNKFYACHWDDWKKKYTLHVFNCPVHLTFDNGAGACNWPSMGPACQDDNLLV